MYYCFVAQRALRYFDPEPEKNYSKVDKKRLYY